MICPHDCLVTLSHPLAIGIGTGEGHIGTMRPPNQLTGCWPDSAQDTLRLMNRYFSKGTGLYIAEPTHVHEIS